MAFFPSARSSSLMRCCAARSSLAGTTSSSAPTAAALPVALRCCHLRTTDGEIASSRASSDSVSSWRVTREICSCLNVVVKIRRPSDPRRCVSIRRPSGEKTTYASQSASSNRGTQHDRFYGGSVIRSQSLDRADGRDPLEAYGSTIGSRRLASATRCVATKARPPNGVSAADPAKRTSGERSLTQAMIGVQRGLRLRNRRRRLNSGCPKFVTQCSFARSDR